jgi:hypothetical protein
MWNILEVTDAGCHIKMLAVTLAKYAVQHAKKLVRDCCVHLSDG